VRTKLEWKWEELDNFTQRARVIGGWIVKAYDDEEFPGISLVFLNDQDHEWQIVAQRADTREEQSVLAKDFEPVPL